jgi:predicted histidine transporter YuiF (NhaC family)
MCPLKIPDRRALHLKATLTLTRPYAIYLWGFSFYFLSIITQQPKIALLECSAESLVLNLLLEPHKLFDWNVN